MCLSVRSGHVQDKPTLALRHHLSAEEQSDRPTSIMARQAPKDPKSQYSLILTIGQGAFSTVKLAYHHLTRTLVAIKEVDNTQKCRQLIWSEVEILQKVQHPNIVRLFEVIEMRHRFYVITEYAKGGDLLQQVTEEGMLEEGEAQRVFGQLVSAIKYCHSRDVVHLDLQPDNVLLDEEANVKLADFGFATMCRAGMVLRGQCGNTMFNAPEQVLGKGYDGKKVDVWSLGVLLYFITTGYHPFRGSSVEEIEKKITTGSYDFPAHISRQLENVIRQMLTVAPERRPSVEDLQQHPWVTDWDQTSSTDSDPDPDILGILSDLGFNTNDVLESLRGEKYDELMGLYLIMREKARKEMERDLEYTTSSERGDSSVVSPPSSGQLPVSDIQRSHSQPTFALFHTQHLLFVPAAPWRKITRTISMPLPQKSPTCSYDPLSRPEAASCVSSSKLAKKMPPSPGPDSDIVEEKMPPSPGPDSDIVEEKMPLSPGRDYDLEKASDPQNIGFFKRQRKRFRACLSRWCCFPCSQITQVHRRVTTKVMPL
ncbi:hypothetical protein STEG23_035830 [Scotinomys teguina]